MSGVGLSVVIIAVSIIGYTIGYSNGKYKNTKFEYEKSGQKNS